MEREANVCINVQLLKVVRSHQQVSVMYPYHFPLLLNLEQIQSISSIYCTIIMPQLCHQFFNVFARGRFEAME